MFPFARLPETIKPNIIELIQTRDLKNLLPVNKEIRSLVLYNGPIPRRLISIGMTHGGYLSRDAERFPDRIVIRPEVDGITLWLGDWKMRLNGEEEPEHDEKLVDSLLFDRTTKWRFMSRITTCRELDFSLYSLYLTRIYPKKKGPNLDECRQFSNLLPNFGQARDLIVMVDEILHFTCIKELPGTFHRNLFALFEVPISMESDYEDLMRILCRRHLVNPGDLWLQIDTTIDKRMIELIWEYGGDVKVDFKKEDDFRRSLEAIIAYGLPSEALFPILRMQLASNNRLTSDLVTDLDEIIRKDPLFERISSYEEAVIEFEDEADVISILTNHRYHPDGYFENEAATMKQFFYRKMISDEDEWAVLLSIDTSNLEMPKIWISCLYRDPSKEEKS